MLGRRREGDGEPFAFAPPQIGQRERRSMLAPIGRFPALHAVLDAGVFDRADPPEEEFAFCLERILDGIEALIRVRARPRGRVV